MHTGAYTHIHIINKTTRTATTTATASKWDAFSGRVNARDTYPKLTEIMLARDSRRSRIEFVPSLFLVFISRGMVCNGWIFVHFYTFVPGGYAPQFHSNNSIFLLFVLYKIIFARFLLRLEECARFSIWSYERKGTRARERKEGISALNLFHFWFILLREMDSSAGIINRIVGTGTDVAYSRASMCDRSNANPIDAVSLARWKINNQHLWPNVIAISKKRWKNGLIMLNKMFALSINPYMAWPGM